MSTSPECPCGEDGCPTCGRGRGDMSSNLELAHARLRDDYRQLSLAYNTLRDRHRDPTDNRKPAERKPVTSYDPADWPYPREWELEDSLLRERAEKLARALGSTLLAFRLEGCHEEDCSECDERHDCIITPGLDALAEYRKDGE